jgi:Carboxypeptidase regulatory-like domain/TonB-dependent Receptor Plug Domain
MKRFLHLLLIGLFWVSSSLHAQSTSATISGGVTDTSGNFIPDAEVNIANDATGVVYSVTTNNSGLYVVPILPPGTYHVQVSKRGFRTIIKPGVVLTVQSALALNFIMSVGALSESITVDAGTSALNTTDASVSTVIDRKFVENIPLNGRSFQDLISMTPGVTSQSPQSTDGTTSRGYNGDFSVNGQRTESNYYTVDGVSGNSGAGNGYGGAQPATSGSLGASTALGTTQSLISVDALQEFRVQSSTYSAEYGHNPGGQFSLATRSGTSQFHGTVYDYLRNNFFDANDWFNDHYGKPISALRQNDFGGTLGGPLLGYRSKTFFFVSYEGLRLTQPQAASIQYVPDTFLRNQAPAVLKPILNAYPLPTAGDIDYGTAQNPSLAEFIQSYSLPSAIDATSVRVDRTLTRKAAIFFRFSDTPSSSNSRTLSALTGSRVGNQSYTFGSTYQFDPSHTNDLRFGYVSSRSALNASLDDFGGAVPIDLGGAMAPGLSQNANPYFFLYFAGIGSATLSTQLTSNQMHSWNLVDSFTFVHGRHVFKAGVDLRQIASTLSPYSPIVEPIFFGATAVLNNVSTETYVNQQTHSTPRFRELATYLQDEWRLKPQMSLSAGIRWEINPPPSSPDGNDAYTLQGDISTPSTLTLAPHGTPLWKTSYYNFAPRLGVAWQAHTNPGWETVLRTGAGAFFDTNNQVAGLGFGGAAVGFSAYEFYYGASLPLTSSQVSLTPSATPPYTNSTVYAFPNHLQLPYVLQWNVSLQQALGKPQSITISYVGSNGRRQMGEKQLSLTPFNPDFGTVVYFYGGLSSNYQALQTTFQRSVVHGLQALVSYTWSHSIDFGSTYSTLPELRGNSDYDLRNNLSAGVSWDIPMSLQSRWAKTSLADWSLDGRLMARTAFPVTLQGNLLTDPATGNQYYSGLNLVAGISPYQYGAQFPGGRAINKAAFTLPNSASSGNAPRNFVRGFGATQLNLAMRREFNLPRELKLQFRAEAFNLLNHPNFGYIDTYYTDATFGQATNMLNQSLGTMAAQYQQGGARSMQFALKLAF